MGLQFPRVVLIGAGGSLGSKILDHLLEEPEITKLTILTRTSSTSTFPSSPRINFVKLDNYTNETALIAAFKDHDVIISTVNDVQSNHELSFISAAIKAGVQRFMPSEYTLDVTHPRYKEIAAGNPLSSKLEVVAQLDQAAEKHEIEYTTVVSSGFLDWGLNTGFIGFDISGRKAILYDNGIHTATGVTLDFLARSVVAVLRMPQDETKNKRIRVAETSYSGKEILGLLEEVTGEKFEVTSETTAGIMKKAGDAKGRMFIVGWILGLNFNGSGAGDLREGLEWNSTGKFAISRKSLKEIVREAVGSSRR